MEKIHSATISQIPHIVNIHSKALPGDFLPRLGEKMLAEFYQDFLKDNCVIVASKDAQVKGFLALSTVSTNTKRITRGNVKDLLSRMILQPSLWGQVFWFLFGSEKEAFRF